jgi:hypothetical protein
MGKNNEKNEKIVQEEKKIISRTMITIYQHGFLVSGKTSEGLT